MYICQATLLVQLGREADSREAIEKVSEVRENVLQRGQLMFVVVVVICCCLFHQDFLSSWLRKDSRFVIDISALRLTNLGKVISVNYLWYVCVGSWWVWSVSQVIADCRDDCFQDFLSYSLTTAKFSFVDLCTVLEVR